MRSPGELRNHWGGQGASRRARLSSSLESHLDFRGRSKDAFYGKNRNRTLLTIFADAEGAETGYKIAISVKKENLLVEFEDFSGTATFLAQVQRKVAEGQKVPAARLVRKTTMISTFEQQMMMSMVSALHDTPEIEEIGLEVSDDDIILRRRAAVMKPLCIYKG